MRFFSHRCAAFDKISTDIARRAVPLRQLSYLFWVMYRNVYAVLVM